MKQTDLDALWQELEELEDGPLDPEKRDALMRELRDSVDVQRAYLEYFEQSSMLQSEAAAQSESEHLPPDASFPFRRKKLLSWPLLAAASLVILLGILGVFIFNQMVRPDHFLVEVVAGTEWSIDGRMQDPDNRNGIVDEGSMVRVSSGSIKLKMESGAKLLIQGPAEVAFPQLNKPVLRSGWLWIDSGDSNTKFDLGTPELLLRNLGTRFGVRVSEPGRSEVHVVDGEVEVFAHSNQELIAELKPEDHGIEISEEGDASTLRLARDPFVDIVEIIQAVPSYSNTVRSQSPVGYWRMEDVTEGKLANQVATGNVGRIDKELLVAAGPGPMDGFNGWTDNNQSLLLPGKHDSTPISLGAALSYEGLIYQDDFSGEGALNGSKPKISIDSAKWVGVQSPSFIGADGSFFGAESQSAQKRGGSATLPFIPANGAVYTLDVSFRDVEGDTSWVAVGFANGRSPAGNKGSRFVGESVSGRAWMLLRGVATDLVEDTGSKENKAYLGSRGKSGGTADGRPFNDFNLGSHPDMDLRIVLDTTEGPGNWTATWYAKPADEDEYRVVRETTPLINESIDSVGIALAHEGITGRITDFSLVATTAAPLERDPNLAEVSAQVSREEGAISFWVRHDPAILRSETLWVAAEDKFNDVIRAHITYDGRVGLFMDNGRFDVLMATERTISDGQWHHVAMTWGAGGAELYINGVLEAEDSNYRPVADGLLPELRVGGGSAETQFAAFSGYLDEIGLWDRELTMAEIQHQYKAALGSGVRQLAQAVE